MIRTIRFSLPLLVLLAALSLLWPQTAAAQGTWPPPQFSNVDFKGSWAVQVTGTVFLPAPFDTYNGPFARQGRLLADGHGNFRAEVVANYAGFVERESFSGVYNITKEGLVTLDLLNVPLPSLPKGTPNIFSFDGVLADGGKVLKLMLTGVRIGPQQLPNVGTVITGELVRQ